MANHKSAIKRARQNERKRLQNKRLKTRIKKVTKEVRLAEDESQKITTLNRLNIAKSVIDKAAKKGAVHRNTASRKISRLSKVVDAIST
ncbi:MAG: 30S ribosomal protein S20 [Desulfobacterales bacterium]|nr:30S ribosomal protein S20 [Desulfobacter sp.]MDP6394569.1 30S ribosomal protein S20 [Desulfobacterales bacterium]MDP6683744.1 30S ribosomal protein S20 [Desulfobacterales bacterium]MDP6806133.1 30S ribosomal protein S20 [Desulfobacterales bacterium]